MINLIKALPFMVRIYSLPISLLSWFVAFCYGISLNGNIKYGIIALFGICFTHMGINALDDYLDYKNLKKEINPETNEEIIINAQRDKCSYIADRKITTKQILITSITCLSIASIIGLFFILKCGIIVLGFMAITALLSLLYPILGYYGLCEAAIFLIYGPLLFCGMDYVMTGNINFQTVIVSLPSAFMTLNILYADTLMDYEYDKNEGKKTLANRFNTQLDALSFLKDLIIMSYISLVPVYYSGIENLKIYLTLITIPLAIKLIKSLKKYIENNLNNDKSAFMVRMCEARDLMVCFSIIFGVSLIWK